MPIPSTFQRGEITDSGDGVLVQFTGENEIAFRMFAINYGKTPAIVTHLRLGRSRNEPTGPANYDECTRIDASFPLGPERDAFAFFGEGYEGIFTIGRDAPFVFGFVAYEAGGQQHTSRFSYRLTQAEPARWIAINAGPPTGIASTRARGWSSPTRLVALPLLDEIAHVLEQLLDVR